MEADLAEVFKQNYATGFSRPTALRVNSKVSRAKNLAKVNFINRLGF